MTKTKKTKQAEWDDPRSFISAEVLQNDGRLQTRYSGQLAVGDVIAKFSVKEQIGRVDDGLKDSKPAPKKNDYLMRGSVSLLNPATGTPLICVGQERKKRLNRLKEQTNIVQAPIARKNIYSQSVDIEEIKTIIAIKVRELIVENSAALAEARKETALTPTLSPLSLYWQKYGYGYLRAIGASANQEQRFSRIARAIAKLPPMLPIAEITPDLLASIQKAKEPKRKLSDNSIRQLSRFWDYLVSKTSLPENPFHAYQSIHAKKPKKDGVKLAMQNATPDHLFPAEEYALNRRLYDLLVSWPDADPYICPIVLGIILAKDAGLNEDRILSLCWRDIEFDVEEEGFVRIRLRAKQSSPIINFTRPVFPFGALVLHKAYDAQKQQLSAEQLDHTNVLNLNGHPIPKSKWTSELRKLMKGLEIKPSVLYELKDPSHQTSASLRYLLNTYKSKVEHSCGLELNDPAAIRYLKTMSLNNDVSAAYYRSFSSPDGLWKLYVAMRRFGTGLEEKSTKCSKEILERDGNCTLIFTPKDQSRLMKIEMDIMMSPEDLAELRSKFGFEATIAVLDENGEVPEDVDTIMYFETQQIPTDYLPASLPEATAQDDGQTEMHTE